MDRSNVLFKLEFYLRMDARIAGLSAAGVSYVSRWNCDFFHSTFNPLPNVRTAGAQIDSLQKKIKDKIFRTLHFLLVLVQLRMGIKNKTAQ
jgi:hypothetical protein